MKRRIQQRGEMAQEVLNARDHLLSLVLRYKRAYGMEQTIEYFIQMFSKDFWPLVEILETDVLAAEDVMRTDNCVVSAILARKQQDEIGGGHASSL